VDYIVGAVTVVGDAFCATVLLPMDVRLPVNVYGHIRTTDSQSDDLLLVRICVGRMHFIHRYVLFDYHSP
jgi:hypothetical protein